MGAEITVDNYCFSDDPEEIIAKILESRGIKNPVTFLNPSRYFIEDPTTLPRIEEAGKILCEALREKKKIFLNVDSDTDGVTSGAIIKRYLDHCWDLDIPWHISQGKTHGTSQELTEKLETYKPDVLIIVDSLDSKLDNYKLYKEMGIQILILDHHDIDPSISYDDYAVLVSSNRSKTPFLSGAGVCWKFCKYMDEIANKDYADELVDLAATGIIADMMDVSENSMDNRAIINQGIQNVNNPAIRKIIGTFAFDSQAVSYSIAPLINACCRYSMNDLAFETFIEDDLEIIKNNLYRMRKVKDRQKKDVDSITKDLDEQLASQKNESVLAGFVESDFGVHGLIANKITGKYKKPTLILKPVADNSGNIFYKGSGRTADSSDFRNLCSETKLAGAFGHPKAFGITIKENDYESFLRKIRNQYTTDVKVDIHADAQIKPEDITNDLVSRVKKVNRITGNGFPQLQFAVKVDSYLVETMTKGKHLNFFDGSFTYTKWNAGDQYEYYTDLSDSGKALEVVGTLDSAYFGRKKTSRLVINEIVEV